MRYFTRKPGSQRQSWNYKVDLFDLGKLRRDGATYEPELRFQIDGKWHVFKFENEAEAKALLAVAQQIYRSFE